MPIHDQSYRRYGGARQPAQRAWLVIATSGIMQFLRRRRDDRAPVRLAIALLVRLVAFYVSESVTQAAALLGPSAKSFRDFLEQQNFFVFLIAVYVGSGLIAKDRAPTPCRSTCRSR